MSCDKVEYIENILFVCICGIYKYFIWCRFYGKNSSYVHGGLDGNGKPLEAVYGQAVSALSSAVTQTLFSPTYSPQSSSKRLSNLDTFEYRAKLD